VPAPLSVFYPEPQSEVWTLFDLRIPGVAQHLHRERAAWQENSEVEMLYLHHAVLIRPGGARRLAA
jgi:hypothetical protein